MEPTLIHKLQIATIGFELSSLSLIAAIKRTDIINLVCNV
mgnify:FL=1